VKLLVVGLGSIGRRHIRNLAALRAGDIYGCDPDETARTIARAESGAETLPELARALERRPDAVLVCTPTHLHLDTARAALAAGAHLFIEKPIAAALDGVSGLAAEARARRRVVLAACNMRFHPGVAGLHRALEAGTPRRPLYFRARFSHYLPNWRPDVDYRRTYSARRSEGGGILLEGVHELDYLGWLGGDVAVTSAVAGRMGDLDIESEDYAVIALQFKSGAAGQVHLDYLSPYKLRGCEVVGVDAVLRWTSEGKTPERVRVTRAVGASAEEILFESPAYDGNEMYLAEMRHFLACVEGRETPRLDAEGAARVLELALAAREASERVA
jgi:predicted dehydrogenase